MICDPSLLLGTAKRGPRDPAAVTQIASGLRSLLTWRLDLPPLQKATMQNLQYVTRARKQETAVIRAWDEVVQGSNRFILRAVVRLRTTQLERSRHYAQLSSCAIALYYSTQMMFLCGTTGRCQVPSAFFKDSRRNS